MWIDSECTFLQSFHQIFYRDFYHLVSVTTVSARASVVPASFFVWDATKRRSSELSVIPGFSTHVQLSASSIVKRIFLSVIISTNFSWPSSSRTSLLVL